MRKHDWIAEKLAEGWSDKDIIANSPKWNLRPADIKWNRRHHSGNGMNGHASAHVPPGWAFPNDDPGFPEEPLESPEERSERIGRQYRTLERMAKRIIARQLPSLVVSGPPGLGKTHTVETELERAGVEADIIRGTISGVGLYIALWNASEDGVIVLDDCDSVFDGPQSLNLLKVSLDSSAKRIVSWRKHSTWLEENDIPDSFEFKGSIVFCTNIDFEAEIDRGAKMSVHYKALIDRSLYVALPLWGQEDVLTRIEQVVIEGGEFRKLGLNDVDAEDTMEFIRENASRFYTLSIRSALQVAKCRILDPEHWMDDARATLLRLRRR